MRARQRRRSPRSPKPGKPRRRPRSPLLAVHPAFVLEFRFAFGLEPRLFAPLDDQLLREQASGGDVGQATLEPPDGILAPLQNEPAVLDTGQKFLARTDVQILP